MSEDEYEDEDNDEEVSEEELLLLSNPDKAMEVLNHKIRISEREADNMEKWGDEQVATHMWEWDHHGKTMRFWTQQKLDFKEFLQECLKVVVSGEVFDSKTPPKGVGYDKREPDDGLDVV